MVDKVGRNTRSKLIGFVVNLIDNKTIKVKVPKIIRHKLYEKTIRRSKNYLVHLSDNVKVEPKIGDKVQIASCRRLSKNKSFRLASIIN
ncbi:30S ribosomal protein S17 [Candidatus Marinamargulisbacteria bacterium SCGC AG-410-N11]|nr:30S ribosomal protein S17 [Candidatus Marinamargulisbacteria bacterium SCGC AG-410-N11]